MFTSAFKNKFVEDKNKHLYMKLKAILTITEQYFQTKPISHLQVTKSELVLCIFHEHWVQTSKKYILFLSTKRTTSEIWKGLTDTAPKLYSVKSLI